jgi:hypothetical protein
MPSHLFGAFSGLCHKAQTISCEAPLDLVSTKLPHQTSVSSVSWNAASLKIALLF